MAFGARQPGFDPCSVWDISWFQTCPIRVIGSVDANTVYYPSNVGGPQCRKRHTRLTPVTTIVVCFVFCRLFKSHFCKQCGPRSEQSDQGPHCLPVCKNRLEKSARIFSRWHKQTTFSDAVFLGALRVKDPTTETKSFFSGSSYESGSLQLEDTNSLLCSSLVEYSTQWKFNTMITVMGIYSLKWHRKTVINKYWNRTWTVQY